jgi:vacuolar-type H+-ATPase subunit I/STV1
MSIDSSDVQLAALKELLANDRLQAQAIEELRRNVRDHQEILGRHDRHISQLDTFMAELRDTLATKEDIAGLRADLRERLERDEFMVERLDHYKTRLDEVETEKAEVKTARETKFNRRMSWAMVVLFLMEIAQGVAQIKGIFHG